MILRRAGRSDALLLFCIRTQMVKDLRTGYEEGNTSNCFDGGLNAFIDAGIRWRASGRVAEES